MFGITTRFAGAAVALVVGASSGAAAEPVPMDRLGPIRGIAADPSGARDNVLLATRGGVLMGKPDGLAKRVSAMTAFISALAADPGNAQKLYASGQSEKDGKLGVLASTDGGATWQKISDGAGGPVAFHVLTVSPKAPNVLYGVDEDMQVSRDSGATWARVASSPEKILAVSASMMDDKTIYAATMGGLVVSRDGGAQWKPAYSLQRPATMVHVTPGGRLYAFVYGTGLLTTREPSLAWKTVATAFQDRVLMGLAVAPTDADRLYAYADTGKVMISANGGRVWTSMEGSHTATEAAIERGRQLFEDNCAACHGERGIGERPGDPGAKDEYGFVAPALNDDAHGWHHPDEQLTETILNGSPRNKRMIAWKEQLTRQDAKHLVTYIKSLWSFRSLACQGSRHMACMR